MSRKKTTPAPEAQPSGILGGLTANLSSLLDAPADEQPTGTPLEISLDLIDQDPDNARTVYDEAKLKELAANIKARGVIQPVGVRRSEAVEGRFTLVYGHRRYRASQMAGKETIPAYVNESLTKTDQLVENLQREDLTPGDIARQIGAMLEAGKSQSDIARELDKSPAWVGQHAALLKLPDLLNEVFESGRCTDVSIINELFRLHKKAPAEVADWLAVESQDFTRRAVKVLKDFIESKTQAQDGADSDAGKGSAKAAGSDRGETWKPTDIKDDQAAGTDEAGQDEDNGADDGNESGEQFPMFPDESSDPAPSSPAPTTVPAAPQPKERDTEAEADPERFKKAIVCARHNERPCRLVLTRRPTTAGLGWVKYDDDGSEEEVALDLVILSHLVEG